MKKLVLALFLCFSVGFSAVSCADNPSLTPVFAQNEKNPDWAAPITIAGVSNLHKVSDDLYRSAQPKEYGMTSLKNLGIKTVMSIRATELDQNLNENENTQLNLVHLPIETTDVKDQNIIDALTVIKNGPKPVLVHCRHGSDRTGLIVAMYRIVFQGWSKEAAKDELVHGGFGYHSIFRNILREIDDADIDVIRQQLGISPSDVAAQ